MYDVWHMYGRTVTQPLEAKWSVHTVHDFVANQVYVTRLCLRVNTLRVDIYDDLLPCGMLFT